MVLRICIRRVESWNEPSQARSNARYRSSTPSNSAKRLRSRTVAAMLARDLDQGSLLALRSLLIMFWLLLAVLVEVEGWEVEGAEGLGSHIAGSEESYNTGILKNIPMKDGEKEGQMLEQEYNS